MTFPYHKQVIIVLYYCNHGNKSWPGLNQAAILTHSVSLATDIVKSEKHLCVILEKQFRFWDDGLCGTFLHI